MSDGSDEQESQNVSKGQEGMENADSEVKQQDVRGGNQGKKVAYTILYYVLLSVSPWKRTWYRQRDKVDFITLSFITFHWLIETMLDHVTVVFSYATAVVLKLKTQSVNIYSGFKGKCWH